MISHGVKKNHIIKEETKSISIVDLFKKYNSQDLGDILRGEKDIGFSVHDGNWMDIGTPERLEKVRQLTQGSK